jgi:hypothetical protein
MACGFLPRPSKLYFFPGGGIYWCAQVVLVGCMRTAVPTRGVVQPAGHPDCGVSVSAVSMGGCAYLAGV